ncbi:hypothetical protein NUU61_000887 [Penicillium alfredii]|uniref:Uncharacterized protein n=1 Tax=Penicillium alfredii TaxID=1506179 RepID=A0A9W9GAY5_9EURO|nr:uncharacterized protein NUU61_000887 [Penicillium alfredii]KAJ5115128.1 hypothetical protein NUU61_000887 [Penicillium alfredii]
MASIQDQFLYQMDLPCFPDESLDFDQFLDLPSAYGDDHSPSVNSISPPEMALPYETHEMIGESSPRFMQPPFPDVEYGMPQGSFVDHSPETGLMHDPAPMFDDAAFSGYNPYDSTSAFRNMVEAHAAADSRVASIKEKRREAAIALHLQRLCDATALDLDMSSDSNTSFSSPCWSDYVRGSTSPQSTSTSAEDTPAPQAAAGSGGVELVLDLNMNSTTNVPKKQKPRSQAQKENYIKARKYGACEKHKKQHKRCNCLEKAAARAGVNELQPNVTLRERPRQPTLQAPILPEARFSGSTGHDPLTQTAMVPVKATMKPASASPGHERIIPSAKISVKANMKPSGTPGHDPLVSQPAALLSSKGRRKPMSTSTGHDPSVATAAILPVSSLRAPNLEAHRPRTTQTSPITGQASPKNQSVAGHSSGSLGLRHSLGVRISGILANPGLEYQQSILSSPKQPLAILAARSTQSPKGSLDVPSRRGSTLLSGNNGKLLRPLADSVGGILSGTVLAIYGAWQSTISRSSWTEDVAGRCLSWIGRQLMSAQKSPNWSRSRSFGLV